MINISCRVFMFAGTIAAVLVSTLLPAFAGETGIVTAHNLYVRVKPSTRFTAVTILKKGYKVTVLDKKNGWYKIAAPPQASVWVSSRYVKNNELTTAVKLRSGPSIKHTPYGVFAKGTKVQPVGTSNTEWTKIAPPKNLTAWVSANHIKLEPAAKPVKPAATVASKPTSLKTPPVKKPVDTGTTKKPTAVTSSTTATDASAELPFISGSKEVKVEGILLPLGPDAVYVTHALALRVKDEYQPICFIHSGKFNLKLWEKQLLKVTGTQRWVKGWKYPVVEVDVLTPKWE